MRQNLEIAKLHPRLFMSEVGKAVVQIEKKFVRAPLERHAASKRYQIDLRLPKKSLRLIHNHF